jgi:hypothetical protein
MALELICLRHKIRCSLRLRLTNIEEKLHLLLWEIGSISNSNHYRLKSLAKKINEKLRPRFYGPYQIIKVIVQVAYKPDLPQREKFILFSMFPY